MTRELLEKGIHKLKTSYFNKDIDELSTKLYSCYSKELCYPKIADNWSVDNKYYGMCAITTLIVNDYFGGRICKIYVNGISHYFNLINNKIIDLTSKQFKNKINYRDYEIVERESILTENTIYRYELLKKKLEESK